MWCDPGKYEVHLEADAVDKRKRCAPCTDIYPATNGFESHISLCREEFAMGCAFPTSIDLDALAISHEEHMKFCYTIDNCPITGCLYCDTSFVSPTRSFSCQGCKAGLFRQPAGPDRA